MITLEKGKITTVTKESKQMVARDKYPQISLIQNYLYLELVLSNTIKIYSIMADSHLGWVIIDENVGLVAVMITSYWLLGTDDVI